jgi:hypothetical protein
MPTRHRLQRRVVYDPESGHVLTVPPGTQLEVCFRPSRLGISRWQVEDRPGHLVPLEEGDHGFRFLVFDPAAQAGRPLRLVRRRVDSSGPSEVRDLTVLVG